MKDINKHIEEEVRKILAKADKLPLEANYFGSVDHIKYSANEILKLSEELEHSSRWRKVSEEMPGIDTPILCKFNVGSMQPSIKYRVSALLKSGRFSGEMDWVSVVEWKPID